MARIEEIREAFEGRAEFVYVYIKEAHPEDEWQMDVNREAGVVYSQPESFEERIELAHAFVSEMDVETPVLVDDMGNTANACFAAWPERIYVVGSDGRIRYKGGMGPFDFDPEELVGFLQDHLGRPAGAG